MRFEKGELVVLKERSFDIPKGTIGQFLYIDEREDIVILRVINSPEQDWIGLDVEVEISKILK